MAWIPSNPWIIPIWPRQPSKPLSTEKPERAILICGTGIGMSITANKFPGIRCALCMDAQTAAMARRHNDANVLALRGRNIEPETVRAIVQSFLTEPFEGGRHQRRLEKISRLENTRAQ